MSRADDLIRVGNLLVGDEFVTTLTHRRGRITEDTDEQMDAIEVTWAKGGRAFLHPDVQVRVVETLH